MSEDRLDRESLLDEINRLLPDPIRDETQLDGESEKSKCQIETLIGLTSPARGTGPLPATRPTNATRNQTRQRTCDRATLSYHLWGS